MQPENQLYRSQRQKIYMLFQTTTNISFVNNEQFSQESL